MRPPPGLPAPEPVFANQQGGHEKNVTSPRSLVGAGRCLEPEPRPKKTSHRAQALERKGIRSG